MKRILIFYSFVVLMNLNSSAQKSSFIVLGNLHYDVLRDHDMDWLMKKPDDLRHVTKEYTIYREKLE